MATKIDDRVRFPSQSTSVLNMRYSVFANIKTQRVFCTCFVLIAIIHLITALFTLM